MSYENMVRESCAHEGRDDSRVTALQVPTFNFGPQEFLGRSSLRTLQGSLRLVNNPKS